MSSKRFTHASSVSSPSAQVRAQVAGQYLRDNFEAADRLAVVLVDKRTQDVLQRIAAAERIATEEFQAWLRHKNASGYEVYMSMNALAKHAMGRTKADVEIIRHLYLDFDHHGTEAVEKLLARSDLPKPNFLINTSPDKCQVVWKARGFGKDQAESLQRGLCRETGADPAATDCSRVLRLPGFYNHKYRSPVWVGVQVNTRETYGPERFPEISMKAGSARAGERNPTSSYRLRSGGLSQSERDWAYAKRALARGEPEELVRAAIANHRRYEKHNPHYYAELTVRNAAQALARDDEHEPGTGPDR
jgi:hypothetical protein